MELEDIRTVEEIKPLLIDAIEKRDVKTIREIFDTVPTIDIAEAASEIEDPTKLTIIFKCVNSDLTADFFTELTSETQSKLLETFKDKELIELINQSYTDDIVDTLEELPANLTSRIMRVMDKDTRDEVNKFLNYKDNTAGSIMTSEYIELKDTTTVNEAIEYIRKRGKEAETVYTIFVKDQKRNFVGTVDLDDLIFAEPDSKLDDIKNSDYVVCHTGDDQEEVANMFKRYDLTAIAVLNQSERLAGIITIDDVIDVIDEENSEDIARLTHVIPTEKHYMELTTWDNAKKCIPWIIALLVLGTFSSMVLSIFENKLALLPILAAFIPTLMDTGGNAGGQTTGLMIRGLALKEFDKKDFGKVLLKEFLSALVVAALVSVFAFLWFTIEQYTGIVKNNIAGADYAPTIWNGQCWTLDFFGNAMKISGLVAGTMFIAIVVSKVVGTLLPMGAAAIKKDPALLSQPMLTTVMDITTLLIYFGVAIAVFPQIA